MFTTTLVGEYKISTVLRADYMVMNNLVEVYNPPNNMILKLQPLEHPDEILHGNQQHCM
jgi:hypothetical protein